MPKVILWRDGQIETEFDPGHRDWRMGRSETNDITLIDPRKSVSRFHAELREENGRWVFIDLNSQNGSWKDGQRVTRLVLEHGHEVLLGDYKLTFQDVRAPSPALPGPDAPIDVDVPVTHEPTLIVSRTPPPPALPQAAPPPVPGAHARAAGKPLRKGVNPLVVVVLVLAMLGALAAIAWKILSSRSEPPAVQTSEAPAQDALPTTAPSTSSVAPVAEVVPPTTDAIAPEAPAPPPAVSTPPSVPVPPRSDAGPEGRKARPKAGPTAPPKAASTVVARYDEGRRALAAGRFAEAERAFIAVLQQQPGFRDTEALLAQARHGQVAAREKLLTDARAFEANGDWSRAVAAYERAGAADLASSARTKMTAAGDDAYRKARQFDARNRSTEATTWYERAVQWLPDGDARKGTAQERLAALKGGGA